MFNTNQRVFQKDKIKELLDKYAKEYDTADFIKNDPSKFIHLYQDKQSIEIAGFIASMFAYGKRELFIKKLETFLTKDKNLADFIKNFDENDEILQNFDYRFSKGIDFLQILKILQKLENEKESLGSLFEYCYGRQKTVLSMLQGVTDYFYSNVTMKITQGFYHLLPNPSKGGAMKRMNMMLRWFIRKSPVDVGIWTFMDTSELIIPLDVHVGNISRQIGLLTRKNNDMKSAVEITENLKQFDKNDPVKYDFALFGIGVNGDKI
ncbi:MAG: TIGR02757 family protein [Candidatus Gastranaerophilales bacterium]|nr:TIGR02757 family protein [Candidatus Gastranaerophilales bacterium]